MAGTHARDDDDRAAQARAERRRQILDAATEVFAEVGYHEASINAIIERAEIARGTFYLYFESKAAVFDSILEGAMRELRARISRIDVEDPSAPPPQVQLREVLVRVLEYVVGDRTLTRILLAGGRTQETEAAQRLDAFFAEIRGIIELGLHHGMAMKLVRPCNKEIVANALLGTARGVIEGLVLHGLSASVDDVVNEMIALSLRGVLAG
ncbi:MAG TPA: helix-turn-helix domain-containing protein [Kofleriaceae bacterium]|nr:helix-turn-helix domain-containing protein [Kofleriaceae bacterium]